MSTYSTFHFFQELKKKKELQLSLLPKSRRKSFKSKKMSAKQ